MRLRSVLLALFALPLLATWAPRGLARQEPPPERTLVWAEPVTLAPGQPGRTRAGKLLFLGGWALRSNDARFGGISAIHVEKGEVGAVTDAGSHVRFPLPQRRGPAAADIGGLSGRGDSKRARDAEALAVAGDKAWVVFERSNSVHRFTRPGWRVDAVATPAQMRRWRANSGGEAIVRLRDGRFLIFSEGRGDSGPTEAILFDRDPTAPGAVATRFSYARPEGYRITDAAELPDGRLLLLNRRFALLDGISARLVIADPADIRTGGVLKGEEVARLAPPLTVDNMEGLSIGREGGRTIVWIASDDNFLNLQRNLLLKFALVE